MDIFSDVQLPQLVSTVVYVGLGLILFQASYFLIEKMTPFSVRKEIEEDQNIALGIIIGSMMIGLALIIASVIMSPSGGEGRAVSAPTAAAAPAPQNPPPAAVTSR